MAIYTTGWDVTSRSASPRKGTVKLAPQQDCLYSMGTLQPTPSKLLRGTSLLSEKQ